MKVMSLLGSLRCCCQMVAGIGQIHTLMLALMLSLITLMSMSADEVAFDNFDELEPIMKQWTVVTGATSEPAYFGWTALDVDSWIAEQGGQERDTCGCLGSGTNNTALIADPDAWDDFTGGASDTGYNSFVSRSYDLSGFNENTLAITFDYEFRIEDSQEGNFELSFDGGTTWTELLHFGPVAMDGSDDGVVLFGPVTFNAGTDFTVTSDQLLIRFGCFNAGNDWWFAIDNVSVTTADGFNDFEDFEGLPLEPFVVASGGDGTDWTNNIRTGTSREWIIDNSMMEEGMIGDGTVWTRDIPNWTVDNSGNLGACLELAYDGWAAMDVAAWEAEQGGQGRTLFNILDPNNVVLVADGDAFYDYDVDLDGNPGAPPQAVNTYISRFYDLSNFDSETVSISFEYEFRIENEQLGVVEVSFDFGNTYTRLLELDNNDGPNGEILADFAVFDAGTDFPAVASNSMILRFGYLMADNNWWFAVDSVGVDADPGTFVLGDINGDGVVNLQDVQPFVDAIINGQFIAAADVNQDGVLNLQDVQPFVNLLSGG